MTWRDLWIIIGVVALALAALALWRAVVAVRKRARAGQPQRWFGLVFRGLLIVGLVALGVSSLLRLPPPELANHNAPAAASAIVAYSQFNREGDTHTLVGASARDGSTRWTRSFTKEITQVTRATPDVILAVVFGDGVYALRPADGATLWHLGVTSLIQPGLFQPGLMTSDASRLYLVQPASATPGQKAEVALAYSLASGAQVWRAPLRVDLNSASRMTAGDGLLFIAGLAGEPSITPEPWGVEALDATTGAQRWFSHGALAGKAGAEVAAFFVTHGNVVIAPRIGPVTALREADGAIAWASQAGLPDANPPQIVSAAADDQRVYVVAQDSVWSKDAQGNYIEAPTNLLALDAGDGTIQWRHPTQLATGGSWAAMAVVSGVLLTGVSTNPATAWAGYRPTGVLLTTYDAASGRLLWQDNTPRTGVSWDMSPDMTPLADNGAVYLLGIEASPYVQDFCVVFCPGVSWLYAVNPRTGAPWWRVRMGYATIAHLVF